MPWQQTYDPLNNVVLSTIVAALPVVTLLGGIALLRLRAHVAALLGLVVALIAAYWVYGMPLKPLAGAAVFGAAFGLFPIGWIVLNLIFLYQLTVEKGWFAIIRTSLARIAPDPRVQVVLIAFSFGAFFEGAAGFGTPVAVTAAILMQLGFSPLRAAGLSLIANTAPVAFGALGTPIISLNAVTGLDILLLSKMVGRQLPFFSFLVPFWVVWAMAGWRGMLGVWPVAFVAGASFGVVQFLVSNFHGPWLVDIVASVVSIGAVVLLLRFWQPKDKWEPDQPMDEAVAAHAPRREEIRRAWVPWILLSVLVFIWGVPLMKNALNAVFAPRISVPGLHLMVERMPPVAPAPAAEGAIFTFNILSATGTAILVAAFISGLVMRFSMGDLVRHYGRTIWKVRYSLLTIAAMIAVGYSTKYAGIDATLGLALAKTGAWYPFFGTLLGWLGVALTGSDSASNILFGGLQKITAEQTGVSPILMGAANSSGGVMGKMVDAQSIVVASTATNWYGHEGAILRFVFFHSIALACLVGILVHLQANVAPFTDMVVR